MPEQKFTQPVARTKLILLGGFPRSHQISQRFVRGVGYPNRRQLTGAITTRQLLGVAAIGLHPVTGLGGH
jgi:hypothetical protein